MRRRVCALFLFLASMIGATQMARAQSLPQAPWYISGGSGMIWRMDASRSTTFFTVGGGPGSPSGPGTNSITFDPGYDFNLAVGYKLPWGFRAEVEGNYSHYTVSNSVL